MAKEKKEVQKKPNAIKRYFTETFAELRKVSWPTRKEAMNLTIIVLIVMVAMSFVLGFLDFIYTKVFELILTSL